MSVFINNKIQLIKKFYTGSLKKQLDKYDVSRSSFYHGFVEKEKLQPMYEEVRDKIMLMLDVIIEIEAVDFIRSKSPEERKEILGADAIVGKDPTPIITSSKEFKQTNGYVLLKKVRALEKILEEMVETEYLKIVIKTMFTQNIIVIAIALGLAIISAFITCITGIKL